MNDSMKTKMIKYLSIGAIIVILATIIWNIFKPSSQSFLIINKVEYEKLGDKSEIMALNPKMDYSGSDTNCTIQIDLNKIKPLTDVEVDKFLRKYSSIFCYKESYKFIEESHRVDVNDTGRRIKMDSGKVNPVGLDTLIKLIPISLKNSYGNYIKFTKDSKGNIIPSYVTNYKSGDSSLSIPTIQSILSIKNINNPTEYNVCYSMFEISNQKHVGLIITEITNTSNVMYYNYSTDPTNPGATIMFNPFFSLY